MDANRDYFPSRNVAALEGTCMCGACTAQLAFSVSLCSSACKLEGCGSKHCYEFAAHPPRQHTMLQLWTLPGYNASTLSDGVTVPVHVAS
jgi:hypothetical protein